MFPTALKVLDDLLVGIGLAQRVFSLMNPILPNAPLPNPLLTTIAALASVVALALLSGIAAGSVFVLLATLLGLYFIATEILGLSVELAIP